MLICVRDIREIISKAAAENQVADDQGWGF